MSQLELTILMPCLDEVRTLPACIGKARDFLARSGIAGEVLIADNGSTDGSQALATELGARVVHVADRGYGAALRAGIAAATGRLVIFADADDSYDFSRLDAFVAALREGADLVVGNRFRGGIAPGAMPWLHRYLGNPVLSWLGRLFFRIPLGDFPCGIRGLNRAAFSRVPLQTTGMEFASEIIVRASLCELDITEVPTTLSRDGRDRAPHLRTWRDGWRHLRFLLLFSPRWLFVYPGLSMLLVGLLISARLYFGPVVRRGITFDVHTMLYAAALTLTGFQVLLFGVLARTYAITTRLLPGDALLSRMWRSLTLESGLLASGMTIVAGIVLALIAVGDWKRSGFGAIDPVSTMRTVIPSVVLLVLGTQGIFASFILSLMGLERKEGQY